MPEINRLDLYDALVAQSPHLKERVIFLTGAARDPRVHQPLEQRGVPLISKLNDLQNVLDAVCRDRVAGAEASSLQGAV